jgi:hypothetical protein
MEADQLLVWKSLGSAIVCLGDPRFQTRRIAKQREHLMAAEKAVAALKAMQGEGKRSDTIVAKNLRVTLRREYMNPLSAEGLLYLDGMPGIEDMLRLPPTRVSDQKLVDAAKRIFNNVRPHRKTFIKNGWERDFIARADRAVKALETHMMGPGGNASLRSQARRSLPNALSKGRKIIKAITRLVQDELADDAAAQTMWMRAKRIPKPMGRPKYPQRSKRIDPPPDTTDDSLPPET